MPIPVPARPTADQLLRYRSNQPASAMHFRTQIQNLNFLRGYVVEPYASVCYAEPAAEYALGSTINYPLLFTNTPGVALARVQLEAMAHSTGNLWNISSTTIDGGAATWINGTSNVLQNIDSPCPATNERLRRSHFGYLSLSGLSTTSVHTALFTMNCTAAQKGLSSLSMTECPYAMIDPNGNPTTEPGVNEAWPDARNRIFAGTASTGAGTQRLIEEARLARIRHRRHWQIATHESSGYTWLRAAAPGTFGALDWQGATGTAYDPVFFMRAARRSAVVGNYYKFHARYKWGGAAGTALIRITCETSENNWSNIITTTTANVNLVNTGGGWTVGSSSAFYIPLDGAGQRVRLSFGAISDGSDLEITNLALIEEET